MCSIAICHQCHRLPFIPTLLSTFVDGINRLSGVSMATRNCEWHCELENRPVKRNGEGSHNATLETKSPVTPPLRPRNGTFVDFAFTQTIIVSFGVCVLAKEKGKTQQTSTFICKVRDAMYVVIFADAHFSPVGV